MTTTMTEKHQITIPKKIADVLNLKKGSMFDVRVNHNRIELVLVETKEKVLTAKQYRKLDLLFNKEKGKEKKISKEFIAHLKDGKLE